MKQEDAFKPESIKFITTQGINYYLYELIKNACKEIILITPYAKINTRLYELLKDKKNLGVEITFVCRLDDLKDQEKSILSECVTQIKNRNNLHAKCYISENEAIISSLNLYEYSQVNNDEMGILVKNNHEIYKDIWQDAMRISNNSDVIVEPVSKYENNKGLVIENPIPHPNSNIVTGKVREVNVRGKFRDVILEDDRRFSTSYSDHSLEKLREYIGTQVILDISPKGFLFAIRRAT